MQLAVSLAGAGAGFALGGPTGAQIGFAIGAYAGGVLFGETIENQGPRIEDAKVTTSAYGQLLPIVWGIYPVAGNIIDASPVREVKNEEEVGKGPPQATTKTYSYFGDIDVAICQGEIDNLLQIRANGRIIFDASADAEVVQPEWLKFKLYRGTTTQQPDPTMESVHGVGEVPGYRGVAHIVFEDFPFSEFNNSFAINFEFLVAVSASSETTLQDTQVSETGENGQYAGTVLEPSTSLLMFPIMSTSAQTYGVTAVDPYTREIVWQSDSDGQKTYASISLKPKLFSSDGQILAPPGEIAVLTGNSSDVSYILRIDAVSGEILEQSPAKSTTGSYVRVMAYDWWAYNSNAKPYYIRDRGAFNGYDFYHGFDTETEVDEIDSWYFRPQLISNGEGLLLVQVADAETGATSFGVAILDSDTNTFSSVAVTGEMVSGARVSETWWVQVQSSPCIIKEVDDTGTILQTINFNTDYSITDAINGSIVYNASDNSIFMQGDGTLYKFVLISCHNSRKPTALQSIPSVHFITIKRENLVRASK